MNHCFMRGPAGYRNVIQKKDMKGGASNQNDGNRLTINKIFFSLRVRAYFCENFSEWNKLRNTKVSGG